MSETTESILEYVASCGRTAKIDRANGVIRDVKILGLDSRNNRLYPESTLREAARLYENAKVNLNHPDHSPRESRKYQDRFGVIRNVRLQSGDGLFGDFHFNPKHALAEQFLWDAENSPENVGFSHNVEAVVGSRDGKQIVEKINAVRSVDLVADPATTVGLFEEIRAETDPNNDDEILEPTALESQIAPDCKTPASKTPLCETPDDETNADAANTANTDRAALLEQLLKNILADRVRPTGKKICWDRSFVELVLESHDTALAQRLIDERAALARRIHSALTESAADGPVRCAAAPEPLPKNLTTDEFIRQISNR